MTHPTADEQMRIAAFLARKVFEAPAGANPNDVQRIAYLGRTVGDDARRERDYGGSNEESLTKILFDALTAYRDHEHVYEDDIVLGPNVVGYACSICGLERDDSED